MWNNIGYDRCQEFINCQLGPQAGRPFPVEPLIKNPAITISRQAGSGGRTVASKLAEYLDTHAKGRCQWAVFDRNLMDRVLEDHHLKKSIAEFAPENHKNMVTDMMEELLGLHPSTWTMVQQTAETILQLAQMGNVILVGRAASVVTGKLANMFHVRLVGSLEKRVERVRQAHDLDDRRALESISKEDKGRSRYLKEFYGKDIDDPLLYHLIINMDRVGYDEAAQLIGDEVIHRFKLDQPVASVEA